MNRIRLAHRAIFALCCLLLASAVAACTIQLAPSYDKTIVDGLTAANQQALTFFASVQNGTTGDFSKREATYNDLIGKFDALRVQAEARPMPRSLVSRLLGIGPSENTPPGEIEKLSTAPTIDSLGAIIDTFSKMKSDDEEASKAGKTLDKFRIGLLKQSYLTSIDQALTYEKALER